jgi:AAA15 family ATPase/GTPase
MKINTVRIQNLLSIDDETITLENYNVVVGPNATGKTNFIRLLKFISSGQEDSYTHNRILDLLLSKKLRHDYQKTSSIMLEISFSDSELTMILTYLLKDYINKFNGKSLSKVNLIIQWFPGPDLEQPPNLILLNFPNGFNLLHYQGVEYAIFSHKISSTFMDSEVNSNEGMEKLFSQFKPLRDDEFQKPHTSVPASSRSPSNLLFLEIFRNPFLEGQELTEFQYSYDKFFVRVDSSAQYYQDWRAPVFDYCGIVTNRKDRIIDCWTVIHSVIRKNLLFLSELRPSPAQLAKDLLDIEKTPELTTQFELIKSKFEEIFPKVIFKILKDRERAEDEYFVQIQDDQDNLDKVFHLENSASGYYEALCIFKIISTSKDAILLMDEPALHLHPSKIKLLSRIMQKGIQQVIILTHSPYFLEPELFTTGRNLVYVQRKGNDSKYSSKNSDFQFHIISPLFRPEIFFSKFVLVVEGAGDAAIFTAISDRFENLLDKQDIIVLPSGGNGTVNNYHSLLNTYNIPHIAVVDSPYTFSIDNKVKILDGKLENELNNLGWGGPSEVSIDVEAAYNFIFNLLQNRKGLDKVSESILGRVFVDAVTSTGGKNPFA